MSQKPVTHTPEPWAVSHSPYGSIVSNASEEIRKSWCLPTHDSGRNYGYDVAVANARRIVACVNACEGVPNELLESISYKSQADMKVGAVESEVIAIYQRDELLAALKGLMLFTKPMKSNAVALNHCMRLIERIEKS